MLLARWGTARQAAPADVLLAASVARLALALDIV
jgi:hypothetical protein